jgi:non-ribosomal peptide synthetase component F
MSSLPPQPSAEDAEDEVYVFPMSFAQQRLWLLDQLEGSIPFYNVPAAVRLTGRLDPDALAEALNEVVARHEILRTNFATDEGAPVQMIRPEAELPVPVVDLTALPAADRETEARRQAAEAARHRFALDRDLLVRASILRLGTEEHVLVLVMHHIVTDGWSMGVLLREVAALYTAFAAGRPSPLDDLPLQYADFAVWQREWLSGEVLDRQSAAWRRLLAGAPPLLALPTDRPRPPVQSYRGGAVPVALPAGLAGRLNALAQQHKASLFMVLLAGLAVVLGRQAGSEDLCIGTPVANRTRREVEPLIGFFVNTLVMRVDLSGDPGFDQLIDRVRAMALSAYDHQDMPFEQVVELLEPVRTLSFSPLFQVMLTLQNAPLGALELPGLTLEPLDIERGTTLYDLSLTLAEAPDGRLSGQLEYAADLFDRATAERLARQFSVVLYAATAEPDRPVGDLPLLDEADRAALLADWNDIRIDYPTDIPLNRLIEAQVRRSPEATALVCDDTVLSYRELDARANRLAHHLRRRGAGPGALVGLAVERSADMVIGVLGILKAGAAYVPLDPGYPAERLAQMVGDAGLGLLVTRSADRARLTDAAAPLVSLDEDDAAIAAEPSEPPAEGAGPDDPAYVIFTSGSTGRPKLAGVRHRGLIGLVHWFTREFSFGPADRNLLITSLSFDLTQKNLFAPLVTGSTLHLLPGLFYDPDRIVALIEAHGITWINTTPSAFHPLVEPAEPARFRKLASLRHVFLGGEPIAVDRLAPWLGDAACRAELVNTYGPTGRCRSAEPSTTPDCWCWMPAAGCCRPAWPANCMSAATASGWATSMMPTPPPSVSGPIPSAPSRMPACTGPAIWSAACLTARCCSWAAPIIRSSCAAIASNRARSRPYCAASPPSATPR